MIVVLLSALLSTGGAGRARACQGTRRRNHRCCRACSGARRIRELYKPLAAFGKPEEIIQWLALPAQRSRQTSARRFRRRLPYGAGNCRAAS